MSKPRYKVVTTEGWAIPGGGPGSRSRPGLTASVLDTAIIHREVARFRSEDRVGFPGGHTLGRGAAIAAAQAFADEANAECARA